MAIQSDAEQQSYFFFGLTTHKYLPITSIRQQVLFPHSPILRVLEVHAILCPNYRPYPVSVLHRKLSETMVTMLTESTHSLVSIRLWSSLLQWRSGACESDLVAQELTTQRIQSLEKKFTYSIKLFCSKLCKSQGSTRLKS